MGNDFEEEKKNIPYITKKKHLFISKEKINEKKTFNP